MRTRPISQIDIEQELLRLTDMLEEETEAFEALCIDLAKKESAYKNGHAKAYLTGKGPVEEKKQYAVWTTASLFDDYALAEGLVKAKREKLLSLRTSIDALRTLNANVRVQVQP